MNVELAPGRRREADTADHRLDGYPDLPDARDAVFERDLAHAHLVRPPAQAAEAGKPDRPGAVHRDGEDIEPQRIARLRAADGNRPRDEVEVLEADLLDQLSRGQAGIRIISRLERHDGSWIDLECRRDGGVESGVAPVEGEHVRVRHGSSFVVGGHARWRYHLSLVSSR